MANVIEYDPADPIVVNRVIAYLKSVNTPDYGAGNYLVNPNLSAVSGIDEKYWKVDTVSVVEMNTAEKEAIDEYLSAQAESADQYGNSEEQNKKYWQMIGRLRRRIADGDWTISTAEADEFIEDLLKDNNMLIDKYLHGYDTEIKSFITNYNVAAFTTDIKTELNSLL